MYKYNFFARSSRMIPNEEYLKNVISFKIKLEIGSHYSPRHYSTDSVLAVNLYANESIWHKQDT